MKEKEFKDTLLYVLVIIIITASIFIGFGRIVNERKVCDKLGGTYTLITGCYIN